MFKNLVCATLIGSLALSLAACSEKKTVCGIEVETAPAIGGFKDVYTINLDGKTWKGLHDDSVHLWTMVTKAGTDTWWFMVSEDESTEKVLAEPNNKTKYEKFSVISLVRVDCSEQRGMTLQTRNYTDFFGRGKLSFTIDHEKDGTSEWAYFPPTKHNKINALVCGRY